MTTTENATTATHIVSMESVPLAPAGLPMTTPTAAAGHGTMPRGLGTTPASPTTTGRFGRMFRHLPVYDVADGSLIALARAMIQDAEPDKPIGTPDEDENTSTLPSGELRLPAGYTYFGQFVDHDITFDPVSSLARQDDVDALVDFRTPRFDLDSVYGRGPSDQPYLYETDGVRLALGNTVAPDPKFAGPDLPRAASGRAIIGDPRNDENLIVSQLQSTVLRFHNAVVAATKVQHPTLSPSDLFKFAQQQVRWHYQWVVVHDYLARLVGEGVVESILGTSSYAAPGGTGTTVRPDLRFYRWRNQPFMPVEFSVAAYRFGHSMVRPSYDINDVAKTNPPVSGVHRIPVFTQQTGELQNLNGFRPLPPFWGVQWKFFLPVDGASGGLPQPSYKIDSTLAHPLGALPRSVAEPELVSPGRAPSVAQILAARNLLRGKRLGLPGGQDVARAMGITPLTEDELYGADPAREIEGKDLSASARADLEGRAPLWYYVLREAEVLTGGAHLGPVGGRIVAETLIGLLAADPMGYLQVDPLWRPNLPSAAAGHFTLADLVTMATG
ncbi:peroxidase family protein [Jatrophihabitans fulvus]